MSYIIKRADGSFLLNLQDETVDTTSLSIPLIGKNVSDYGAYFNNAMVSLLQNFASTQQPRAPSIGQLWYDKADNALKVYTASNTFDSVIPSISSPTVPANAVVGDLWVDTTNKQLKVKADDTGFKIVGPIYTANQGESGFSVITVLDDAGNEHNVVAMMSGGVVIAVVSSETFTVGGTFVSALGGIVAVSPGITLNSTLSGNPRFVGTSSRSALADQATALATVIDAATLPPVFLTNYPGGRDVTTGTFTVKNDTGMRVGFDGDLLIRVDGTSSTSIVQTIPNVPLKIKASTGTEYTAIMVDSQNRRVGIGTEAPQTAFHVVGTSTFSADVVAASLITTGTNQNMVISPSGTGKIDVSSHNISNLADPILANDAANKQYVDAKIYTAIQQFSFSVDETKLTTTTQIISILNTLHPVTNSPPAARLNLVDGTRARVLGYTYTYTPVGAPVTGTNVTSVTRVMEFVVASGAWAYTGVVL